MQAGFAAVDITPPLGTHKIGMLRDIVPTQIHDPLHARAAVFDDGETAVVIVQLDTLSIRWSTVEAIRRQLAGQLPVPPHHVLVGATHNHAGPAVAVAGDVPRDDAYLETLVKRVVQVVTEAWEHREPAELGYGRTLEFGLSYNRRPVMRDGFVYTLREGSRNDVLYREGPIDPAVPVLAARRPGGELLGLITNFTAHPTHHGAGDCFSGGWPGALVRALQKRGIPDAVFLQGCTGNVQSGHGITREDPGVDALGEGLADAVFRALDTVTWQTHWPLRAARRTVQLPYRDYTQEEVAGTIPGAQRFIDSAIYDRGMPGLLERIRQRGTQPAEVQLLAIGDLRLLTMPGEIFVEYQLAIKQAAYPHHAIVAGYANGMVGYVPTETAMRHGGYETTFAPSSRHDARAGALLQKAALELLREHA